MPYNSNAPRYNSGSNDGRSFDQNRTRTPYQTREVTPPPPVVEAPKPVDLSTINHLTFKGNAYGVDKLKSQSGPEVRVTSDEMHLKFDTLSEFNRDVYDLAKDMNPIITKYEGKYVVLLGHYRALEQLQKSGGLKGKLLSSPALKNAKLQ